MAASEQEAGDQVPYVTLDQIDFKKTFAGFCSLALFRDDMYLRMQAFNLQVIDEWTTHLEYQVLQKCFEIEKTPEEAFFLNAQSQMWIMAVYEVLRTWRQRVKDIEELARAGAITQEIDRLRGSTDYFHAGVEARISLLEDAARDEQIVDRIHRDRKRVHIAYRRVEALRMNLAKHEVRGKKGSIANMPGYGRINMWCGFLDYELSIGRNVLGNISRRDIANSIRALADIAEPPADETLASFDEFMKGPPDVALEGSM